MLFKNAVSALYKICACAKLGEVIGAVRQKELLIGSFLRLTLIP